MWHPTKSKNPFFVLYINPSFTNHPEMQHSTSAQATTTEYHKFVFFLSLVSHGTLLRPSSSVDVWTNPIRETRLTTMAGHRFYGPFFMLIPSIATDHTFFSQMEWKNLSSLLFCRIFSCFPPRTGFSACALRFFQITILMVVCRA